MAMQAQQLTAESSAASGPPDYRQDLSAAGGLLAARRERVTDMVMDRPVRFIIPKKGRLRAAFEPVMAAAGITLERAGERLDYGLMSVDGNDGTDGAQDTEISVESLFMRPTDALRALAAGVADMVLVGRDVLREFNEAAAPEEDLLRPVAVAGIRTESTPMYATDAVRPVDKVQGNPSAKDQGAEDPLSGRQWRVIELALAPCALRLAVPDVVAAASAQAGPAATLAGCRIATSYPAVLRGWLRAQAIDGVEIVPCEGGVEDQVRLGRADAVCDLVETGTTLAANGLTALWTVMESRAVLVCADTGAPERQEKLRVLAGRIAAALG